jgi:hypothetical protein
MKEFMDIDIAVPAFNKFNIGVDYSTVIEWSIHTFDGLMKLQTKNNIKRSF